MRRITILNGEIFIGESVIVANENAAATSTTAFMLCAADTAADAKLPRVCVFTDFRIKTTDDPRHAEILCQAAACSAELADAIIATSYLPGPYVDGVPTAKVVAFEVPHREVDFGDATEKGAFIISWKQE